MSAKWLVCGMLLSAVGCSAASPNDPPTQNGTDAGLVSPDAGSIWDECPADGGTTDDAGTTPDAGAPEDGGTTADAGTSSGDPCGAAGLSVCDDFESAAAGGPPSSATWNIESFQNQGSLSIDDTVAHSGSKSVHVTGSWSGSFQYIVFSTAKPFPAPNNSFYTRVFLRSKSAMGDGHSTYFGGYQSDWQRTLRVGFNHFMLEANLTHPEAEWELQSGDWVHPENGIQFVPETWHCVEAFFNGADNEIRVWFEGQEVQKLHGTDWGNGLTSWSPNYQVARFGFETYHGEQAELWYDDVAIGSQRIGCGE